MTTVEAAPYNAIETVERLRPTLEHYRDEGERERRLPDAVVAAMKEEGLFKLWLPREYGGLEVGIESYLTTIQELSRIDSGAGWTLANTGTSSVQAAFMSDEAAREIFARGELGAGSLIPRGRAVEVPGGYRVTGRWPLMSGCHHARWLAGHCIVFDGDAPKMTPHGPEFLLLFCEAADCTIIDTWHSTGMRATGSADVEVEDAFVPAHRALPLFTAQSRIDRPLYRMRIEMHFFLALANVGLGIARSAIDSMVEIATSKTPTLSQTALAARPTIHVAIARAEATYQAARAYMHEVAREIEAATQDGPVPDDVEARRRLACLNAAEASEKVVDAMYRLGGMSAIYAGQRLDRCLRDIHTVNQHLAVSPVWWEKTGQYYFGQGLGMP